MRSFDLVCIVLAATFAAAACGTRQVARPAGSGSGSGSGSAAAPPSAPASDRLLVVAEAFMSSIQRGDRGEAYRQLHPKMRAVVTEAAFNASLDSMDATFGRVVDREGKQVFVGVQESPAMGKLSIRRYTYAVTTTKHPRGTHFAAVTIMGEGDDAAVQTYNVFTFTGDIPPGLR